MLNCWFFTGDVCVEATVKSGTKSKVSGSPAVVEVAGLVVVVDPAVVVVITVVVVVAIYLSSISGTYFVI